MKNLKPAHARKLIKTQWGWEDIHKKSRKLHLEGWALFDLKSLGVGLSFRLSKRTFQVSLQLIFLDVHFDLYKPSDLTRILSIMEFGDFERGMQKIEDINSWGYSIAPTRMNQQERQALRDIHTKVTGFTDGKEIVPYCLGCGDYIDDDRQPYPCDVIKILDAWDSDVGRNCEPARRQTKPTGTSATARTVERN